MALPLKEQRYQWLRFNTQRYTKKEQHEYETRLANIYYMKIHRVYDLDFARLSEIDEEDIVLDIPKRLRMEHNGDDGEVMFTSFVWKDLLGIHRPLVKEVILEFSSTFLFRETIVDLDLSDTLWLQLERLRRQLSMR
nr:hypothetical protein [Tanacetum cinerariifolium]